MEDFLKEHFFDFFNLLFAPLFYWIWQSDRKILVLENELKSLNELKTTNDNHFQQLHNKLNEIKDEIHQSFVSFKTCDFRHNQKINIG